MPTTPNLPDCASSVRSTYFVEPRRMEKAVALYEQHSVKKLGKPESIWHVQSPTAGRYTVDDEHLTCDCIDWNRHNSLNQQSTFVCKHIASVLLSLKIQAEYRRLNPPVELRQETPFDEIMKTLFAQPLTVKAV